MRRRILSLALAAACAPMAALAAAAEPGLLGPAEAEALVRAVHFEGLPYDRASRISDAGAARLAELLRDPGAARWHAHALVALGLSGRPAAFPAIAGYLARARAPVDLPPSERDALAAATFRAERVVPDAMGHLARVDDRALSWLAVAIVRPTRPRDWPRPLAGEAGERWLVRRAMTGLALSGRPAARDILRFLRDARPGAAPAALRAALSDPDRDLASHLRECLDLHDRIARRGAAAVLSAVGQGRAR